MLNQKRLKEVLNYDFETGTFIWLVSAGCVSIGKVAGWDTGRGYKKARIDGKEYYLHRLAFLYMTGKFPPQGMDHINGVRSDNRWKNLRGVTHSENHMNRGISPMNTSGVMGVSWDKSRSQWSAKIKVNRITTNLGRFNKFTDAVQARKLAEGKFGFHENHGLRKSFHQ